MAWPAHMHRPAKGAGHGGPAKGAGVPWKGPIPGHQVKLAANNQPPGHHKSIGHMEAKEYRELLRQRREKALAVIDRVLERADDDNADMNTLLAGVRVVEMIDNRIDGRPNQSHSGPEDGPIVTEVRYRWAPPQKVPDDGA